MEITRLFKKFDKFLAYTLQYKPQTHSKFPFVNPLKNVAKHCNLKSNQIHSTLQLLLEGICLPL